MTHTAFYSHALDLSQAIQQAIGTYCQGNGLPWNAEAFNAESPHDIDEIARDALFYGAETFPDAAVGSRA